LAANSAWAKLVCFMIVPGRFDCRGFDFNKSSAQAELISVSLVQCINKINSGAMNAATAKKII